MSVGKDLVERVSLEDATDVEVREVSYRDEVRRVGPCTMLDGQRPDFGFCILKELVKTRRLAALCGEGEVLQVSKLGENELSSPIGRSGSKL